MDLNINSPAYFSQQFGVDDEIYRMCRDLSFYVKEKTYSKYIDSIGIVPIVAPIGEIATGKWKETKKCEKKYSYASVSMHLNYEKYVKSSIEIRKGMIIDNILQSVKIIAKKGEIDYSKFETDVLMFCEINKVHIF